jgi:hypothetical protein
MDADIIESRQAGAVRSRGSKQLPPIVFAVALAACSGSGGATAPSPPQSGPPQVPPGASALVASMFQQLPAHITSALAENQANLPRNPQLAAQINAKIALLQRPNLAAEISNGRFFAEGSATSTDGRAIAIAALFPEERLRAEASESVRVLERALVALETFIDTPFPASAIRLWYGFKIGNSGGGGQLFMEDRTSYDSRTTASRLPYDAILAHEQAHSYISNESLTQFLEMYVYNTLRTGSTVVASWELTRDYVPFASDNKDSAALLDVYQLIGHAAMSAAYKAVVPLRPPYGEGLSPAARQVFVDAAPDAAKVQVAEKMTRITF